MGVQAVVTTGIYCRPGCGGRPNPANVRPFLLAAAAEAAGYRACLRCRPYRADPPLSPDAPELVCRAIGLVVAGGLDDRTEEALGTRLGVSPRHLRRLFQTHLGVTPDQLARSRRAHFARRLLDDTDLSFSQIAFASGFGSIRQFNRVCQEVFGASPRELRARRRLSDRLVADGGLALRLPISGDLAWDELLSYLERRAIPGVESVREGTYRRTVVVDGDPGVLELSRPAEDHVVLVAHLPHWEGLIHLVERARRIVSLDVELEGAHRHLRADPVIGPLVARAPGLRPPGTWDPFETAVRTVCGQRISVAAAMTVVARIVERHGAPVLGIASLGLSRTFPPAEVLAEGDLDGLGLTGAGVGTLRALAGAVADGSLQLDRALGLERFVESVRAIRGLGPWSAHYLALRLGHPDAFPAEDLGLRRALEAARERPASARDLEAAAEPWRPFRALAATHLWFAPVGRGRGGARLADPQVLT
jgi:AraC family transcriptional regulator, regulatory protein of adaptative response / DNA-3-methyladenine glycosylase II